MIEGLLGLAAEEDGRRDLLDATGELLRADTQREMVQDIVRVLFRCSAEGRVGLGTHLLGDHDFAERDIRRDTHPVGREDDPHRILQKRVSAGGEDAGEQEGEAELHGFSAAR